MKKVAIFLISFFILVSFAYGQVGETDFAALPIHAIQKGKEIIGKEYIYDGGCDKFFTLSQFVEPDILVLSWIPGKDKYGFSCRSYQAMFSGKKIMLKIKQVEFERIRRIPGLVNKMRLGDDESMKPGESSIKVINILDVTMSDGTIMAVPVCEWTK